jgi:CRP-like cAMP-binding protein
MVYYNVEIFKGLDQNFEQEILKYSKLISFKKKDTPFLNNELLRFFYIVLKGRIKTYQININTGKEQTIFIYKKRDMFDTITLLDGKPHDVMYEVLEDVVLLELPIEKVREWLKTNENFNRIFFPYIASQMRHTEELATDISLYSTYERLTKIILQSINPNNHHYYKLLQNLSKTEIAKLLGTIRHVVERHLKALEKKSIIENKRKNISVKDTYKLLQESENLLVNYSV